MTVVRRATYSDLEEIVAMGRAMHEESPRYRGMRFDGDKVRRLAIHIMMQPEFGVVFIVEAGAQLAGLAAVVAAERWFGPDRYLTDLAVYLKPEHRGNGAFLRLVQAVEEWASEHGIEQIDLGVSTDVQPERTVRAYERMGYTLCPTSIMTKRPDDVHRS
jgi:GNAT superfamily N-acetyltransferase